MSAMEEAKYTIAQANSAAWRKGGKFDIDLFPAVRPVKT
jgi:hypothetical protein